MLRRKYYRMRQTAEHVSKASTSFHFSFGANILPNTNAYRSLTCIIHLFWTECAIQDNRVFYADYSGASRELSMRFDAGIYYFRGHSPLLLQFTAQSAPTRRNSGFVLISSIFCPARPEYLSVYRHLCNILQCCFRFLN